MQQGEQQLSCQASCCIIGDVNIDHIADLSHVAVSGEANPCVQNPIVSNVGGNAVFFAEAACEAGFGSVAMLCSIGDDAAGSRALEHLHELGVVVHNMPNKQQTGQVIIMYQPDDRRIMVADRGANREFRAPENGVAAELIQQSDLLYVSGYMLLNADQCAAVHTIANAFRAGKAKVFVDMVPHDVWRTISWRKYVAMCSCADCVAAEMSTVSMFHCGLPDALQPDEAAELLLRDFKFCLVRINDVSDFIVADRARKRIVSIPYRRVTASLRFTDRVIAHAMQQYVTDPNLLFESDLWLSKAAMTMKGAYR